MVLNKIIKFSLNNKLFILLGATLLIVGGPKDYSTKNTKTHISKILIKSRYNLNKIKV